jgi:uncharacterized protein (TIGR03437 family)
MTSGSVVATFSNGDPPVIMARLGDGRWGGTWQGRNTSPSQVTITASAEIPELRIRGTVQLTGGLRTGQDPPLLAPGAVVSAASLVPRAPLAPGSIVSIFGSRLARAESVSPSLPLPNQLADSLVTIGDRPLPLIYASPGQINAIVPYELPVNTRHQIVVRRGAAYAVPETVTLAAAQPAIFTKNQSGRGQGVILDQGNRLVERGNAAAAGEVIVLYCSGLGAVDPPVTAGAAAPASPLSATANPVKLSIGGVEAQVLFAGLTPGFTGLYQVNAVVPPGVSPGDEVEAVVIVAGQASLPVTLAVR